MRRRHRRDAVGLPAAALGATPHRCGHGGRDRGGRARHRTSSARYRAAARRPDESQLERVGRPRIAGIAKARVDLVSPLDPRVGRREVADREHDLVDVQHTPVPRASALPRPGASAIATTSPATRTSGRNPHARRASSSRVARYSPYVRRGTKEPPVSDGSLAPDEAEEVVGIVLERAHPPGRHVQRVAAGGRRVRDAADLPLDALDEQMPADGRR